MLNGNGDWVDAPPVKGGIVVNLGKRGAYQVDQLNGLTSFCCVRGFLGEMLQIATQGYYLATVHRVQNRSSTRSRISVPYFYNPSLEYTMKQVGNPEAV